MPRTQEGLARLVAKEGVSGPVVEAFRSLDRRAFVPVDSDRHPYADRPILLPERQTTSQPTLIARMIDAASIEPWHRVLEVGTGYGFQTALLASLAAEVVSVERVPELARAAATNIARAAVDNVEIVVGDGWLGVPERAPYDRVIVSASAARLPRALVAQLIEGGLMVIPLAADGADAVWLIAKRNEAPIRVRLLTPARFVPLVPGTLA